MKLKQHDSLNYNNFNFLLKAIKKLNKPYSKPKQITFDKNRKFLTYFKFNFK